MARYRVAEGRALSHSERVNVNVPQPVFRPRSIPLLPGDAIAANDVPQPGVAVGYARRDLKAGDELELNDEDGKRLLDAGVVEAFNVPAKRRKDSANKARKPAASKRKATAKV